MSWICSGVELCGFDALIVTCSPPLELLPRLIVICSPAGALPRLSTISDPPLVPEVLAVDPVDPAEDEPLACCELCFIGATDAEIAACEMPVPHALEAELLAVMGDSRETVVAYALLPYERLLSGQK